MESTQAFITALWSCYITSIIIKIFLFLVLCKYFILKIRAKNEFVRKIRIVTPRKIMQMLHSYDAFYREINEYNSTYWSQFLFAIWLFFGVVIVNLIYLILFAPIASAIKIICIYFGTLLAIFYLIIMTTASSLNCEAFKSYNVFHYFTVKYYKSCKPGHRINLVTANKVF